MKEETLKALLEGCSLGQNLILLDEVDSTNSYLKREAKHLPAGTVCIADSQTGGRGRMGRGFQSPAGKGLYCSLLLRPELAPAEAVNFTAYAAIAVCGGVEAVTGCRPQIKWTNDIVLKGKKICGVLTEMTIGPGAALEHLVLGFGLNVSQRPEDWPEDLRKIGGSLEELLPGTFSREELAAAILREVEKIYHNFISGKLDGCLEQYRADCLTLGREVRLVDGNREALAFAEEIDRDFGLVVRYPDGRRETVRSGEVSVRGLYGYL